MPPLSSRTHEILARALADRQAADELLAQSKRGQVITDVDGATVTFDVSASDWHTVTLGASRILALEHVTPGVSAFTTVLVQGGTGSNTVTWWSGIQWPGGTPPTLTTTLGKADVFTFKCISTGVYYGFIVGQNL